MDSTAVSGTASLGSIPNGCIFLSISDLRGRQTSPLDKILSVMKMIHDEASTKHKSSVIKRDIRVRTP